MLGAVRRTFGQSGECDSALSLMPGTFRWYLAWVYALSGEDSSRRHGGTFSSFHLPTFHHLSAATRRPSGFLSQSPLILSSGGGAGFVVVHPDPRKDLGRRPVDG